MDKTTDVKEQEIEQEEDFIEQKLKEMREAKAKEASRQESNIIPITRDNVGTLEENNSILAGMIENSEEEVEKAKAAEAVNAMNLEVSEKGKVLYLQDNFRKILDHAGIKLKYDVIERKIVHEIDDGSELKSRYPSSCNQNDFLTGLQDLSNRNGLRISRADIANWFENIAMDTRENVIKCKLGEFIATQYNWGGTFDKYMDCMKFVGDAEFSKLLFKKALVQSIAMVFNEHGAYGAEGVLVLKGKQAVGKTSMLRNLCSCFGEKYFMESAEFGSTNRKDDIIQNTSVFMCELGEGRKSLQDVDFMKRFITNKSDTIRTPYSTFAITSPRYTTFYMTVNDDAFLRDVENRRYWTVEIESVDFDKIEKINYKDLWAEVYCWYMADRNSFRLTPEDRAKLQERNSTYRDLTDEETILHDVLDFSQPKELWREKTVTEISNEIKEQTNIPLKVRSLTKALSRLKYNEESIESRILDGRKIYRVPAINPKAIRQTPFDKKDNGTVVGTVK